MNLQRFKDDLKYIIINKWICNVPSWRIRRYFLKKFGMVIDNSARIGIGCIITSPERIQIGEGTIINEYCHLDGRGGLIIDKNVSVSIYTKIVTASHVADCSDFSYYEKKTHIEDNVWIGCGAIILDGSTLKKGAIIGAGCVFKGVADELTIYVGNPSVLLRKRNLPSLYQLNYRPYFR